MKMVHHLYTVEEVTPETEEIQQSSSPSSHVPPGKGSTGAVIHWNLHMTYNNWNINITNGWMDHSSCKMSLVLGPSRLPQQPYTVASFTGVTANNYAKGVNDASQGFLNDIKDNEESYEPNQK